MDKSFARRMSALTSEFYERVAPSFSATRQAPWQGWHQLLDYVPADSNDPLRVLDVACGNLRFERFLVERGLDAQTWAWDNCDQLVATDDLAVHYEHVDLAEALLAKATCKGGELTLPAVPPCDLAVSFGFMHHLPLYEQRQALLETLVERARPEGYVCATFWQFADDERLLAKAWHIAGGTENDYLLGWQDLTDIARFCHHTPEQEIDGLVASVASAAVEVARFSADGKSGRLNRYVMLRVR